MTKSELLKATVDDLLPRLSFYDWDLMNQYADEKYLYCGEDITKEEVLNMFGEEYFLNLNEQ